MRLPKFLTEISPVRETLDAIGQGERVLSDTVAEKNQQALVGQADTSLSLWEADYGLSDYTGKDVSARRALVRAAIAGGRTLTPAYLKELCATLCGAERVELTEDFPHWRVDVVAVAESHAPADPKPLEAAIQRLKPAHLEILLNPVGLLTSETGQYHALTGGEMVETAGDDIIRVKTSQYNALTLGVLAEVWERNA